MEVGLPVGLDVLVDGTVPTGIYFLHILLITLDVKIRSVDAICAKIV